MHCREADAEFECMLLLSLSFSSVTEYRSKNGLSNSLNSKDPSTCAQNALTSRAVAVLSPISRNVNMRLSAIFRLVFSKAGLYRPMTEPSRPTIGIMDHEK